MIIFPQHNPVILAKQAATLDKLSGGRFLLGVGVGWLREEFESVGSDFATRGARTDEGISAMREIWANDIASFSGEHYGFPPLKSFPKPTAGHVPVHIGGDSVVAARRAGRSGDGFFPAMWPTERIERELPSLLGTMRVSAREAGRDPSGIEVTSGGARTFEDVKWFADQGVDQLTITVRARDDAEIREELLRFGDSVISKAGAL